LGRPFTELIAYIDGASPGNPGQAGVGVSFQDSSGKEIQALSVSIGEATNNVAEYHALILALEEAPRLGVRRLTVFSDSELLVKQFNGQYRVKTAHLRTCFDRVQELGAGLESLSLTHVSREQNQRADELARRAARRGKADERSPGGESDNRLLAAESAGVVLREGVLSLNEVALLPVWSEVQPGEVDMEVSLAGDIRMGMPFLVNLTCSPKKEALAAITALAAVTALRGAMPLLRPGRSPRELVEIVKRIKAYQGSGDDIDTDGPENACLDRQERPRVGVVLHPDDDLSEHVSALQKAGVDLLVLEASLGHGSKLLATIARLKESQPQLPLLAGDVTDGQGAEKVLGAGADGVKVGAPYILGLKVPLFSVIRECAPIVQKRSGFLLADVGTTELMTASSRIARALGAGADLAAVTLEPAGEEWQPHILTEGLDSLGEDIRMILSCCGVSTVKEFHRRARFVRV